VICKQMALAPTNTPAKKKIKNKDEFKPRALSGRCSCAPSSSSRLVSLVDRAREVTTRKWFCVCTWGRSASRSQKGCWCYS
jgi:hypothetical protein